MKKIFIIISCLSISLCLSSQITLLKEFIVSDHGYHAVLNTNDIYTYDTSYNVKIFNSNADEVKTIMMQPDYKNAIFLSINLFTTSGNYEYISRNIVQGNYCLFNEYGTVLYNFEDFSPDIIKGNKLYCRREIYLDGQYRYEYRVFSLGGAEDNHAKLPLIDNVIVYPNPTSDLINIKYHIDKATDLVIYNMSGQSIAQYNLDPYSDLIQINLTNFKYGTYIYKYGAKTGKFIVE